MVKTMEIMERLSNAASSASLSDVDGDHLEHHGIIGQKWGVRRFQPYPKGYRGDGKYVGKDVKPRSSEKKIGSNRHKDESNRVRKAIDNKYDVETPDDDMMPKEKVNTKLGKATYFDNASYWAENDKEYENCARFVNDAKKKIPEAVEKADAAFKEILTEEDKKKYKDILKTYGDFDNLSVYSISDNQDDVRKNYTKSDLDKFSSLNDYMVFVPLGKEVNDPDYKSSSAQLIIEFRNGKPRYEIQTGDSRGYPYADKDSKIGSPQSDHKKEIKDAELKTRHQNKVRMEVTRAIEEGDKKRLRKVADKMTTDEYVENLNKLVSKGVTEATNKGDPDQLRKYKKDLTPKEYENAKNLAKFNKAINELDVKAMNSLMSKISTEDLQKGAERLKTINDMQEKKLKAISRESEVTATLQRISKFTKVVSDLSTHAKTIKSNVEEIRKSENNSFTNNQEPKKKEEEKKKDTAKHSDILISDLMNQDYLEHHGIIGQKWGKRHGPPYPLSGKVSAAVKRGDNPKTKSSGTVYGDAKKKTTTKSKVKKAKVDHFKEDDPDEEKYRKSQAVGSMVMSTLGLAAGVAINAAMISSGVINPVALVMPLASSIGIVAAAKELHDASKANKLVEKLNKERAANTKIDKKTGLKLKQKEMTREEDLKHVNPGYKNFQPNTKSNCMLCTTTYDIRRRGYDVTAQKAAVGYSDDDIKKWYKNAKVKQVQSTGPASLIRNTKQELVAQGEGARGNLMVQWSGANSGHSMAYEIHDGKVVIYDAQSNEVIKNPDKVLSMSRAASYVRLDNLQPNWKEIKKECVM